jgi:hypothetical protein
MAPPAPGLTDVGRQLVGQYSGHDVHRASGWGGHQHFDRLVGPGVCLKTQQQSGSASGKDRNFFHVVSSGMVVGKKNSKKTLNQIVRL